MRGNNTSSSSASENTDISPYDVQVDRTSNTSTNLKIVSTVDGESCTWKAHGECTTPRSCFECLNVNLKTGEACAITPFGSCVSINEYDPSNDFRRPLPSNVLQTSRNYFPSTNATYCAHDDKYCSKCREAWINPNDDSLSAFRRYLFCRGENGCVCTRSCELPFYAGRTIMNQCVDKQPTTQIFSSIAIMLGLCTGAVVATLLIRKWIEHFNNQHDTHLTNVDLAQRRAPSGPNLNLSGWYTMREKLINTEREQLESVTTDHSSIVALSSEVPSVDAYSIMSPTRDSLRQHV